MPDKVALICDNRRVTYREIETEANQIAHGLIAKGVQRGDRVVLFLDNSVEAAIGVWAVLKAGAVFVMANPTTKPDKLTYLLNNSRASCIVAQSKRLRGFETTWAETPHLQNVIVVGKTEEVAECTHPLTSWTDLVAENTDNTLPPQLGYQLYDMENDPLEQRNVAAAQPEMVTRMTNQYEAWFRDVTGGRDYADRGIARIAIGSPRENPVRLTRQDWRGPQAAWTATSLGHWEVDVQRAGIYDVTLRFAGLTKPGIVSFALGASTLQRRVPAGASRAVFNRVRVTRGAGRLESWVTQDARRIGMLDAIITLRR